MMHIIRWIFLGHLHYCRELFISQLQSSADFISTLDVNNRIESSYYWQRQQSNYVGYYQFTGHWSPIVDKGAPARAQQQPTGWSVQLTWDCEYANVKCGVPLRVSEPIATLPQWTLLWAISSAVSFSYQLRFEIIQSRSVGRGLANKSCSGKFEFRAWFEIMTTWFLSSMIDHSIVYQMGILEVSIFFYERFFHFSPFLELKIFLDWDETRHC